MGAPGPKIAAAAAALGTALASPGAAAGAGMGAWSPARVAGQPPGAFRPMRIMSLNLCTDLLLLQIAPRTRIVSVTWLAHDAVRGLMPGADAGVGVNHGTSEDIINGRPDLILTGDYAPPLTRKLAARAVGASMVRVAPASDFAGVRAAIRTVGAAVGAPARAEALIGGMDAVFREIAATPLPRPVRVVAWSGGAAVPGQDTLTNAIIQAAGAVNIAAAPGARDTGFDVEQLLQDHPDALLFGAAGSGAGSLRAEEGRHPLVLSLYAKRRIPYDETAHECGLPQSATSALALHRALLRLWRTRTLR